MSKIQWLISKDQLVPITIHVLKQPKLKIAASALGEALKVHGGEGMATLQDHRMIDTYLPSDAITE